MNSKIVLSIYTLIVCFFMVSTAFAQPAIVKKCGQSVFALTTFNSDGTVRASSHGVFTGNAGEAIAMWHVFVGASRAVIIDAKGKQYDVDVMLGVSENYNLCRFRVKGYANAAVSMPLTTTDATPTSAYVVGYDIKKPVVAKVSPQRSEKFMTNYNYLIFRDEDISADELGCPVVSEGGQLLGIMQRPEAGGQAFSADARLTISFKITGFSINDQALRATGIRTALPADQNEAAIMLVLASGVVDSAKYESYVDDYIKYFPTATEGYNAKATRLVANKKLADADAMLQTEVKRADKKDVAYSNYAALVYQASIYKSDSTFTKWNLDRALELSREASKVNPLPTYLHQQAQIMYAQGKYKEALDMFTSLQETDLGKSGEVYYEAAQCKTMLKAPKEEVMALLDSAVNVQPGAISAPFVLARGRVYDADGQSRKAFKDYLLYDSLMNYNVQSDEFYYIKYRCESKIRQFQLALNDIAHAIILNRREPVYYAEMASLQLRVNKPDDAIKTCDMALQLSDKYADIYIIKGIALCETGKKTEGIEALQKAKELGDGRADGLIEKYSKK